MLPRKLKIPDDSILLLGPRGTGKSTWIKQNFKGCRLYDLLDTKEFLRLSRDPSVLFREAADLESGSWVIIDEVQRVPILLNEVHRLIEDKKLRFILSGSSARKLRRGGSNLLAGRAVVNHMFPFVSSEVDFQLDISRVLKYGMLPMSYLSNDPISYLTTYAEVYLEEEIKNEALTRNLGGFGRFLEVAARQNGQLTNVSNISRDAQVARQTVQGYFDILNDTLIGYWLYPWKLKRPTKQVSHPKFYFFDPGVARALSGRLPYPPSQAETGPLFETFVIGEVKAYLSYSGLNYSVYFWSSQNKVEVDIFCETSDGYLAVELKSTDRWDKSFNRGLKRMSEELSPKNVRTIGVFTGERGLIYDGIEVMPAMNFLKELWLGKIIV